MPKMRTNKAAAKRFKANGAGKLKRGSAFRRHLLTVKSADTKRKLRSSQYVHGANMRNTRDLMPYSF